MRPLYQMLQRRVFNGDERTDRASLQNRYSSESLPVKIALRSVYRYHYHLYQIISTFVAVYVMSKSLHDDNHTDYPLCF